MLSLHSSPVGTLGAQNTGGMSIYVREVSRWLGRNGHQIDIFTGVGSEPYEAELYPNVRLITLGQGRFTRIPKEEFVHHLPQLVNSVERYGQAHDRAYDLIHSHYWISGAVGAVLQAQWHCPHMVMFHTLGAAKNHHSPLENETTLRIGHEQRLVETADFIVVPSQGELENLRRHYQAARQKIGVVPCGVDLERFQPQDWRAARQRLGLSAEAEVILYVGRFAPLKAVDTLIAAVAELRRNHPNLRLIIVGGDDTADQSTLSLKTLAGRLGIQDQVHFAGRVKHEALPDYYGAADLLALPSHYESFGLVVLEALACGTPVAATAVGAAASLVREGLNGAVIAAAESQAVAQAIGRILQIPRQHRPTAAQIRAAVESLSWQWVADAIQELYARLLTARNPIKTVAAGQVRPPNNARE